MNNGPTSSVTTTIDFSLAPEEHYVQFVPPSKFGVTYNSATREVHLDRADGKRGPLHGRADKIYTLRGFIGLMQRENLAMALGWRIEDEIIRNLLASFESWHDLRDAVQKFCPFPESARLIATEWAAQVFALDADGKLSAGTRTDRKWGKTEVMNEICTTLRKTPASFHLGFCRTPSTAGSTPTRFQTFQKRIGADTI